MKLTIKTKNDSVKHPGVFIVLFVYLVLILKIIFGFGIVPSNLDNLSNRVFIANFEHISYLFLVFLLLTLSM